MSTNFAILKIKKIRSLTDLHNASLHGLRQDKSTHFDLSRTHYNRHWCLGVPTDKPANWAATVASIMDWKKAKARRGAPVAAEILVSASGPFFEGDAEGAWPMHWSKATVDAWADANIEAFEDRFPGAIAAARLDMDEGTPHLTLCVVPLYWKRVGDRSVQWVSFRKTFGGEKKEDAKRNMIGWQDWYAARMAPFGLARGISKEITGAVGLTHHEYRSIKQQQDLETQAALDAALAMEAQAAAAAEKGMQATLWALAAMEAERERMRTELAATRAELEQRKLQIAEALADATNRQSEATVFLQGAQKRFEVAKHYMLVLKRTTGELHSQAAAIDQKSRVLDDLAAETDLLLEIGDSDDVPRMGSGP